MANLGFKNCRRLDLLINYNNCNSRNALIVFLRNELPVLSVKARFSQEELADKMGISKHTYSYLVMRKK